MQIQEVTGKKCGNKGDKTSDVAQALQGIEHEDLDRTRAGYGDM